MKQALALFDFDGTLTTKDSLLEFMKFASGKFKFLMVMLIFAPVIFYYVFVVKDGEIAKMKVLSFLYKGKKRGELEELGRQFANRIIPKLLLPKAMEEIRQKKELNTRIIVISASLDIWLKPWTDKMEIELLCTGMEFQDDKFTGRFSTPNCNGEEKVNRIKGHLKLEDYMPIYAYGNSSGDKPMLALADHPAYKPFED